MTRRLSRVAPGALEPGSRVRVRAGRELLVVDVSPGGAIVESDTRLLPGTHVEVHVATPAGRLLLRTHVVQAHVSQLSGDRIVYRCALAFDGVGLDV